MTPTFDQIKDWDSHYILQTYGRLPVALERGEGALLWDVEGKRYIDLQSGGRAGNALGHAHPKIVEALTEQAKKLLYCSNDFYPTNAAQLAKELAQTTTCQRIFFQNSGAEANECAIKLARKWAKREHGDGCVEIVTAFNSFHGRTLATITATGQPKYQEGYEPLPGGFRYIPFNDVEALKTAIGPQTAALMFEPILGETGCVPASPEFLQTARQLCDEKGILLILDEVQTGFGRTGTFWAYEAYGIEPDIVTLAKSLGGGLPMGACFAREEVATAFQPGDHGCTFGGNPASSATALAALKALREDHLIEEARRKGERLQAHLHAINEKQDVFSDIRGRGLMAGVDLKEPLAKEVMLSALDQGLILSISNPHTIRLLPAYVISDEQLQEAMEIFADVLSQTV
jgi:acetylornithine/N-succinyldiaminopimelate aminotransferase